MCDTGILNDDGMFCIVNQAGADGEELNYTRFSNCKGSLFFPE